MQRKTISSALFMCTVIALTLYIGNLPLSYGDQSGDLKILNESNSQINKNKAVINATDLYPEIRAIKLYLCDDDWHAFKGGCDWYCAAEMPIMSASSELKPYKTISYGAQNAHDFNLDTVWSEGVEGYGLGETLTLTEDTEYKSLGITHFEIINGYVKSEKLWQDNSRVKQFDVSLNGEFFKTLYLEDCMEVQSFEIGLLPFSLYDEIIFEFKIMSVYPGKKYQDTVITELELDGVGDH